MTHTEGGERGTVGKDIPNTIGLRLRQTETSERQIHRKCESIRTRRERERKREREKERKKERKRAKERETEREIDR